MDSISRILGDYEERHTPRAECIHRKLPTTSVVGFPPRGVSAHTSSAVEGGLYNRRSGTRKEFLRGFPTCGLRPNLLHTALIIGGLPPLHGRGIRPERRCVIRSRFQGVSTEAPPRTTHLADRECITDMGVLTFNSSGGETGRAIGGGLRGTVGLLPRLKSWASSLNLCELPRGLSPAALGLLRL